MEIFANRFEEKEFFLSDLIMTGEVMHEGTEILKAYVEQEAVDKRTCDTGGGSSKESLMSVGKASDRRLCTSRAVH